MGDGTAYPEHLLPRANYTFIPHALESEKGLVLIRHIEHADVVYDERGNLDPNSIHLQSDHLRDLSNNLLGVFKKEDIFYGIDKSHRERLCALWEEGTEGICPKGGEFFRDSRRGWYFIRIDTLLGCKPLVIEGETYRFMVYHTPTQCNFWHISIRLINAMKQEVSTLELSKRQRHKIWAIAKEVFVSYFVVLADTIPHTVLPQATYVQK